MASAAPICALTHNVLCECIATLCPQELKARGLASSEAYAKAVADAKQLAKQLAAAQAAAVQAEHQQSVALDTLQVRSPPL
jgi:hypothetical protein